MEAVLLLVVVIVVLRPLCVISAVVYGLLGGIGLVSIGLVFSV